MEREKREERKNRQERSFPGNKMRKVNKQEQSCLATFFLTSSLFLSLTLPLSFFLFPVFLSFSFLSLPCGMFLFRSQPGMSCNVNQILYRERKKWEREEVREKEGESARGGEREDERERRKKSQSNFV